MAAPDGIGSRVWPMLPIASKSLPFKRLGRGSIYGAPLAFYRPDWPIPCAEWQVRRLSWVVEQFGQAPPTIGGFRPFIHRLTAVFEPFFTVFPVF
jgi:hypothetical protein